MTFPATGAIFISMLHYGLSSTQYGALFIPQAILAIASSLAGPRLVRTLGAKTVFLCGMTANLISMALLIASQFIAGEHSLACPALMVATSFIGVAFGLTVPVINTCAAAFLYGLCETMNGNWASIIVSNTLGNPAAIASLTLTIFWGTVTGGLLIFASIDRWIPGRVVFKIHFAVICAAFLLVPLIPSGKPKAVFILFALVGLGCSAMLTLIISFGRKRMPAIAASVAGLLIAFYQVGYGVAAFGVGPLENLLKFPLPQIFAATAATALTLAFLAALIGRRN